jgi:hypothetical protein
MQVSSLAYSQTLDFQWTTRCYIPEHGNLQAYICFNENHKLYNKVIIDHIKLYQTKGGCDTYVEDEKSMQKFS